MSEEQDLEAAILAFLRNELGLEDSGVERETPLVSTALIDSADLVRLATEVESLVGTRIPDRDINADHFDTVEKILAYVRSELSG